jgi:hypothetical protein
MNESAAWSKLRMLSDEPAGRFDGSQITVRYVPIGIANIPLELPLYVGDEIVRLADTHEREVDWRAFTRA